MAFNTEEEKRNNRNNRIILIIIAIVFILINMAMCKDAFNSGYDSEPIYKSHGSWGE